ncbi:MAG: hypothetical protein IKJ42_07945 [Bacteroidaceae bacterium]|nr:hypothetical protein [Bacteroidaceae bacterium]
MKDLIPILVVVVILILKARNAMKEAQPQTEANTSDPLDWEGEKPYWEEEEQPETTRQPMSDVEQILTMLGQPRPAQTVPAEKSIKEKPAASTMDKKTTLVPQPTTPRKGHSIGNGLRSPQEARRAFIYSEIFKRKYN